ncbi:MAG TPA: hypothetical protein DEF80_10700 [Pantoea sp.]|nr:hypothetical protein [Pantoea sp.]
MVSPLVHKNLLNIKVFTALIRVKNVKRTLQTRMIMIIIAMRFREVARQPGKARHCSHCFQYYFASLDAGFFLPALLQSFSATASHSFNEFEKRREVFQLSIKPPQGHTIKNIEEI